ncbi:Unknown protein [Striga hermonthica]|uniref:Uncharacterized protein n=1 Tax=Striga hermonthica TaxID=68872 RepID=A0A9N7RLY8_STRHE|nr:Unknown protein [Striga hermonthica]
MSAILEKHRETERLHQFLMGLNSYLYGSVRSNLLSTDPLPTLERAYSRVVEEERLRSSAQREPPPHPPMSFAAVQGSVPTGEIAAMAAATSSKPRSRSSRRHLFCTHCSTPGHEITNCYQLIGYPENWSNSRISGGKGRGRGGTGRGL